MAAPMSSHVDLGFLENTESFLLRSRFFPSKVGGKPAWLSLKPLPSLEDLSCRVCGKPVIFLLQAYSPGTSKEEAFHRTVFVFVCPDPNCCKPNCADNFRVYRSQLPRENDFYSFEPPVEHPVDSEPSADQHQQLCVVCGAAGGKRCGKCHRTSYCSKDHQTLHWKASHKKNCSTEKCDSENLPGILFPETELVTEPEDFVESKDEKSEEEKMKEYEDFMKSGQASGILKDAESELEKMSSNSTENEKQFLKFKKRIKHEPDQVLRYDKGQTPLWIAHEPVPRDDTIPDCSCGAKRQFEFQILSTLLSHLNVDKLGASLDWGTLCIYTCTPSCSIGNQYKEEFLFKQDIV